MCMELRRDEDVEGMSSIFLWKAHTSSVGYVYLIYLSIPSFHTREKQ